MGNLPLNTGWPFNIGLTGLERKSRKENLKVTKDPSQGELSAKCFIPLPGIVEKKLQNLITGRPYNNALTAHYCDFSWQSDRLIQVKIIKIVRLDLGIGDLDRLIEGKFTVIKGRIFQAFFNWPLNRGWPLNTGSLNTGQFDYMLDGTIWPKTKVYLLAIKTFWDWIYWHQLDVAVLGSQVPQHFSARVKLHLLGKHSFLVNFISK